VITQTVKHTAVAPTQTIPSLNEIQAVLSIQNGINVGTGTRKRPQEQHLKLTVLLYIHKSERKDRRKHGG
jgi:hypothetical protein